MQGFRLFRQRLCFINITKQKYLLVLLTSKMKIKVGQDFAWKPNILALIFFFQIDLCVD